MSRRCCHVRSVRLVNCDPTNGSKRLDSVPLCPRQTMTQVMHSHQQADMSLAVFWHQQTRQRSCIRRLIITAWNVTVPDTYAESHIGDTATEAGAAVNQAAANKITKYDTMNWLARTSLIQLPRNRRYLEPLGHWACPRNRQTGHINHWRTQRIHLSVSAVVNSPPKRKCGRLPPHLWLRFDAVAVISCLVQC